jgi:hypothetical protein
MKLLNALICCIGISASMTSTAATMQLKGNTGIILMLKSQAEACNVHLMDQMRETQMIDKKFSIKSLLTEGTMRVFGAQTEPIIIVTVKYVIDKKTYSAFCMSRMTGVDTAGVETPNTNFGWKSDIGWFPM